MAVGITIEAAIAKVATQQAELPQVISDVLADIADGTVGADDDLGVFVGAAFRELGGSETIVPGAPFEQALRCAEAAGFGLVITQHPLFFPSVSK